MDARPSVCAAYRTAAGVCCLGIVMMPVALVGPCGAQIRHQAQSVPAEALKRIASSAERNPGEAWRLLTALAGQGPRLSGSPAVQTSVNWAMERMRQAGLSQVRAETWELPRGWTRGRAEARLLGPAPRSLTICSYGWTGSTRGRVQGSVVIVGATEVPHPGQWRGRILLLAHGTGANAAANASNDDFFGLPGLARRAEADGALALLAPDTRPGPIHTGAFAFSAAGVAGLAVFQDSPNYTRIGHSAEDTVANTNLTTLLGNIRVLATLAFGLADLAPRPNVRWDRARIREEMKTIDAPEGLLY